MKLYLIDSLVVACIATLIHCFVYPFNVVGEESTIQIFGTVFAGVLIGKVLYYKAIRPRIFKFRGMA